MDQKALGPTRALTAEFIGTFTLIFIGAGAATALGANHDPAVAFAHGLTIMVFIAAILFFVVDQVLSYGVRTLFGLGQ